MGKQGALSSSPPGFWPAASSSINSTQGNGEGGKGGGNGEKRGTDEYKGGRWRATEVQEEDAASTIPRMLEEGWENRTAGKEGRVVMEGEWKRREGGFW